MSEDNKSKCRPIYSMKMAALAMLNGFVLVSMDENFNGSGEKCIFL